MCIRWLWCAMQEGRKGAPLQSPSFRAEDATCDPTSWLASDVVRHLLLN
jgi:hypothetical protein